jgi:hypothetical protein
MIHKCSHEGQNPCKLVDDKREDMQFHIHDTGNRRIRGKQMIHNKTNKYLLNIYYRYNDRHLE